MPIYKFAFYACILLLYRDILNVANRLAISLNMPIVISTKSSSLSISLLSIYLSLFDITFF